jgi:hypothetical protein
MKAYCKVPWPRGVPHLIMLPQSAAGTVVADVGPVVYWLLFNHKVIGLLSGAAACALIWKTDGRFRGQKALAAGSAVYLLIHAAVSLCNYECWDFEVFYQTGTAVVQGTDPYANSLSQYLINALPFFGFFALFPYKVSSVAWYVVNVVLLFAVVRLCQILVRLPRQGDSTVPWYCDAHVVLAVLLAGATTWGLDAGQLVIWTTLWTYIAIAALANGRDVSSGFALAAASAKITTMFPFLLLLFDRRHWKAWIAFALVMTLLCLCLYQPGRLPGLLAKQLENVRLARQVGAINDYGFSGPYHDDMLGLEHWLYCLGMRDYGTISLVQLGILFLIGLGLLREQMRSQSQADQLRLPVLLCIYSCVFLYHRIYDALILALPLFYCVDRARNETRGRAWLYKAVATGLVLVLNFPRGGMLIHLANWAQTSGTVGRSAQIVVLPYCTWFLLTSLLLIWYLSRQPRPARLPGAPPEDRGLSTRRSPLPTHRNLTPVAADYSPLRLCGMSEERIRAARAVRTFE